MNLINRRHLLKSATLSAAAIAAHPLFSIGQVYSAQQANSPFKIAVINDEISDDFDRACSVIARDFGLGWIELRSMWGTNVTELTQSQIDDSLKILAKYKLQVTDIASPLFKTDWPGAPKSPYGSKEDLHLAAATTFQQQDALLLRSIELAKIFKTSKIRCFDFWRLEDQAPHRAAIDEKLRAAAELCGKHGLLLVLENEFACNTATGREAARTLSAIPLPHLALNWDPANAVMRGELDAFPAGFALLPKERIHHCHCKNAVKSADGKIDWSPVGTGIIDWAGQFRALRQSGYSDAVSLETHWHGAATPEESSRISWAGMKKALVSSGNI